MPRKKKISVQQIRQDALMGLQKIAFGDSNDAVQLLFVEETPTESEIRDLDLCAVSKMKRIKGGGVEVEFVDRMKAMEALIRYADLAEQDDRTDNLLEALQQSTQTLNEVTA